MKRNNKLSRQNRNRIKNRNFKYPRLSVFKSNKFVYAQIIDDMKGQTLVASMTKKTNVKDKLSKSKQAEMVGQKLAAKAKEKKISRVFFDRGRYKYHGVVKKLAESAREGGLKF